MKKKNFFWSVLALVLVSVSSVTLSSCGDDKDEVSASPSSLNIDGTGGSQVVTIKSNTNWVVTGTSSWLNVSSMSGSGNGQITLSASNNETGQNRSCTLTIIAGDAQTSVSVSQGPGQIIDRSLSGQVAGTYSGKLMNGTTVLRDAYIVTITKLTDNTVSVKAEFFGDKIYNFNLTQSNSQINFVNETIVGFNMVYSSGSIIINYQSSSGMLTYTGTR